MPLGTFLRQMELYAAWNRLPEPRRQSTVGEGRKHGVLPDNRGEIARLADESQIELQRFIVDRVRFARAVLPMDVAHVGIMSAQETPVLSKIGSERDARLQGNLGLQSPGLEFPEIRLLFEEVHDVRERFHDRTDQYSRL